MSRFVLISGFCQSLQHNPRWPRYARYLRCVSQHCQSGATRSGREGKDSTGAQKRINQSLPSSPSSYCCWLSSKFSCRRRKTEFLDESDNFRVFNRDLNSVSSFLWGNSTGNLMEWQNSAYVCIIWSLEYWTQSCTPQLQWLKSHEGFISMAGCSHLLCLSVGAKSFWYTGVHLSVHFGLQNPSYQAPKASGDALRECKSSRFFWRCNSSQSFINELLRLFLGELRLVCIHSWLDSLFWLVGLWAHVATFLLAQSKAWLRRSELLATEL